VAELVATHDLLSLGPAVPEWDPGVRYSLDREGPDSAGAAHSSPDPDRDDQPREAGPASLLGDRLVGKFSARAVAKPVGGSGAVETLSQLTKRGLCVSW
jgi:hypothetical protein